MKNKREEIENLDFTVDTDSVKEEIVPISDIVRNDVKYSTPRKEASVKREHNEDELVSCLRDERVIVRYITKQNANIRDVRHVLYGGMAETASRTFTVPMLNSGALVNVLTDQEKSFLEYYMGLEYNALSIYKKNDNYWKNYRVRLLKTDTYLDLSVPEDYIRYKVLLSNKDLICPSLEDLRDRKKATYQYVIINEGDEIRQTNQNMSVSMEASLELGKILENKVILKHVVEVLSNKPIHKQSKLDFIQGEAFKQMQANPKLFISIVKDPHLKTKVLISECVEYGIIRRKNDYYYLVSTNEALCSQLDEPTLSNAAKYLDTPKRQELKLTLEAKLKAIKE